MWTSGAYKCLIYFFADLNNSVTFCHLTTIFLFITMTEANQCGDQKHDTACCTFHVAQCAIWAKMSWMWCVICSWLGMSFLWLLLRLQTDVSELLLQSNTIYTHESNFTNHRSNCVCSHINGIHFSTLDFVIMFPTVFRAAIKASSLFGDVYIDSYSKLTRRWGFERTRLTLLWSQSTTGAVFEEESALSIRFHFGSSGRRRAVELVYIQQQNQTRAPYANFRPHRNVGRSKLLW